MFLSVTVASADRWLCEATGDIPWWQCWSYC